MIHFEIKTFNILGEQNFGEENIFNISKFVPSKDTNLL